MRAELQSVLESVRQLPPDELPQLLGELETIRATALLKMAAPPSAVQHDELLTVQEAAERLCVSTDYMYDHAKEFSFSRREGRKLLFSSQGIDAYIQRRGRP